jgi:hypothetical protein
VAACAGVAAAVAIFLWFAGDGFRAYFTPDDMMNLYGAWMKPWEGRLAGTLFYRAWWCAFGLDPLPYRIACMALLAVNLGLLFEFARRLAGSVAAGAAACLLGAYHAHLADLYYSTGTVYDLFCYAFWFGAFVWYVRLRERGEAPGWAKVAALAALYLGALASKEMAVTLPAFVALYEVLYQARKNWRFVAVSVPLTAAFAAWKLAGPEKMASNPAYTMHFTFALWAENWRHYLSDFFYGVRFTPAIVVGFWIVLLAVALALRRKAMVFGWCVAFFGALPVLFIARRGLYAAYLALPGLWLYGASLLDLLPGRGWISVGVLAAALIPLHAWRKPIGMAWVSDAFSQIRSMRDELRAGYPSMPPGARVLFVSDPYPEDDWILTFIFRLHYRDPEIRVDRVRQPGVKIGPPESYTHVLRFENGKLKGP